MTVFCIECGAAVDAAAPTCGACGAAQTIEDDAPLAAPAFPTAAVMAAVKPPPAPEPEPEPDAPAPLDDELDLPAPLFPTAAIIAVPPPAAPEPEPAPAAEEPEPDPPAPPEDELDLPAPAFPTAAILAVPPPPPPPPPAAAPEPAISFAPAAHAPAPLQSTEPAPLASGTHCANCGNPLAPESRFCMTCGTPRAVAAAPAPAPEPAPVGGGQAPASGGGFVPPSTAAPADWQASLPGPFRAIPLDLLIVCALMAVAGLFTLWPVLRIVPDMLDLLTSGESFGRSLGLLLLTVWLVLAFFGVACLVLAWRLAQADRVARGLTYVLLGGLAAAIALGNVHTTGLTIVLLACLGAIGVLAFAPGPRTFFAGGEQGDHPDGLVIARVLVAVWSVMVGVVGLLFLPLGPLGSKFVIVGLLLLGVAGAAFYLNGRLAEGDPTARIAISAGAGVYLVLLLILSDRSPGLLLPLAVVVGIAAYLWIPKDVQRFFETTGARQP